MMVMPANHSSPVVHYWAGAFPGRIGWLVGPTAMPKTKLRPWMPFALDNDAFSAFASGLPWNEAAWIAMLNRVKGAKLTPRWILVPDVVGDPLGTLSKWNEYEQVARSYGWPLAIAVQDGMTPDDLPHDCVVFVGGSPMTDWKWTSLPMWIATGRRVHVGRVNSIEKLLICERMGVESIDGTGWMRETMGGKKARDLGRWIEGRMSQHPELWENSQQLIS